MNKRNKEERGRRVEEDENNKKGVKLEMQRKWGRKKGRGKEKRELREKVRKKINKEEGDTQEE